MLREGPTLLPETAGYVVLGQRVLRVGEYVGGVAHFDQMPQMKIRRALGYSGRLLHGMGNDHDREAFSQLGDQLLDNRRCDGIQGRTGFVHQDHLGIDRNRAGDTQTLLLPAGQTGTRFEQPVLDLFPQAGLKQRILDDVVQFGAIGGQTVYSGPVGDIVVDRFGKRIGFLKHHPDTPAQSRHVYRFIINIPAVQLNLPLNPDAVHQIVHAVYTTQQR